MKCYPTNPFALTKRSLFIARLVLYGTLVLFQAFYCFVSLKIIKATNFAHIEPHPLINIQRLDNLSEHSNGIERTRDTSHTTVYAKCKKKWLISFFICIFGYLVVLSIVTWILSNCPWYISHPSKSEFYFNNLTMGIYNFFARSLSNIIEPCLITYILFKQKYQITHKYHSLYSQQLLSQQKIFLCLIIAMLLSINLTFAIVFPTIDATYVYYYYASTELLHVATTILFVSITLGLYVYVIDKHYIWMLLVSLYTISIFIWFCDRMWIFQQYFRQSMIQQLLFRLVIYNGIYRLTSVLLWKISTKLSKYHINSMTFFLPFLFMASLYNRFLVYDTRSYWRVFINAMASGIFELLNRYLWSTKRKIANKILRTLCCWCYPDPLPEDSDNLILKIAAIRSYKMMFMDYISVIICPVILCSYFKNRYGFTIYSFADWDEDSFDWTYLFISCLIQLSIQIIVDIIAITKEHQLKIYTLYEWYKSYSFFYKFQLVFFISGIFNFLYAFNEYPNDQGCDNLNYCTCLKSKVAYEYLCT
eukprot:521856_1